MKTACLLHWAGLVPAVIADIVGIPTVPFTASSGSFKINTIRKILVDSAFANSRDGNGWTLIPPTLSDFATTFATDLQDVVGHRIYVNNGSACDGGSVYLTIGNDTAFHDAAGRWTSEAYSIDIAPSSIKITGASPLGVWWGTRTILQQIALSNGTLPLGQGIDAPGWGTRGIFLDAGRHYYPPNFIVEMCNWISFYKQNIFHLHLSDNLYNNVDIYSRERQLELYAAFRLWSDDPAVAGLNRRRNESYTREDFDHIQYSCAARGVTIIPEIEAPGHALVITQWKPELGLDSDLSLLNITYPDTIPVMETVWKTFLPWMHSKVVHIGADEYVDEDLTTYELATLYNTFVNALNSFISSFGKSIRIWGTYPPQANYTNNINTNVTVQHWEFFEDNPYFDYIKNGYPVINSDDAFYIVNKYSTSYPQELNRSRIFHRDPSIPGGGPYAPNIFDINNATNNPARSNPLVVGHIAAQWNDYGPNTSTYLEAYYSWRNNLPALADKQWGGNLTEEQYDQVYDTLQAAAPAQNLDRRVRSKGSSILHYEFTKHHQAYGGRSTILDLSGNHYDAHPNCTFANKTLHLRNDCSLTTPLTSKGNNYTFSFTLKQTSRAPGPLFTGPDSELRSGNGTSAQIMLVSAGNAFALNYSLPVGEWVDASLIGRGNRTFFAVDGGAEMEFLTKIGVNGASFAWARMAVVAPLQTIGGGGWEGEMKGVKLVDYA